MITNPPPKDHHSATWKALLSSSKGALSSNANTNDESMLPIPQDHNTYVDNPSLWCVFHCEGNGKPSQHLSLSLFSANPSVIVLQPFELKFPWKDEIFQKSTNQIQQNHHDHHNSDLQEGHFGKSTNFTPYGKGKFLKMLGKVFVVLLLILYVELAESTPNGTANSTNPEKHIETGNSGHHSLSDLEQVLIIVGVLLGYFILIVLALCIYTRWTERLPKLSIRKIESFPLVRFPPEERTVGYGISACEICLEDFTDGLDLRLLPSCGHVFHTGCILIWLNKHHAICPVCRYDYSVTV